MNTSVTKEVKFVRIKNRILNIKTDYVEHFKSVNAAKRKSRELQMQEDGALGLGSVIAKDKLPKGIRKS